jgi:serine phosphatase RsbU (regulator of sigma subunit)
VTNPNATTTVDLFVRSIPPIAGNRLRVLLVEDDPGDAFLVRELLAEADAPIELTTAQTMAEARPLLRDTHCVLLDLGLPDASGLNGLRQLLQEAAGVAICVLTGLEDEHLGIAAVGEGAQDYLVKGTVDGQSLNRAVRYAVERKRADENARLLREAQLRQAESSRLERLLLPKPIMDSAAASLVPIYRPGRDRALLGGDFYDVIATSPHCVQLLIGDVCGHGVEEAALGVALRVAWRALVLAGVSDDAILPSLEQVLVRERRNDEVFVTVAMVTIDLAAEVAQVRLAGHPPPVLLTGDRAVPCQVEAGLVLGVLPGLRRPATEVSLGRGGWSLLLYTDGLIEGLSGAGDGERLGVEGLCALLTTGQRVDPTSLPLWLIGQAEQRNGGPLPDDVAVLLISPVEE